MRFLSSHLNTTDIRRWDMQSLEALFCAAICSGKIRGPALFGGET